ncbi:NAD-dependent epimerase/dehydratase family protein [Streptomyces sp. SID13726]|uniref:NAD-dependent epimerase/dehydratase family protein n=1 Tax=Streptomyces sp. SID13726 TaxID=2706058 RepID=UPI0013B61671|nr:NAD-dependent epimerase/dehydratase family protein [Streptomyces sp. SID13726]NEA98745.1 NAD-dependent epimerase/dehydratase family protein [Streptomyces sp. SID13726]
MRIVVIGGSGHIGTFLVPRLVRAGHEVVNISRGSRTAYTESPEWRQVRQVVADREREDAEGVFGDTVADLRPDVVVDLVCFTLESATALVERLRGEVGHLLHCGTLWRYGPSHKLPIAEGEGTEPFGEYGIQKDRIARMLKDETAGGGLVTTSLHPGHIVGEGWDPIGPLGNNDPAVWRTLSAGRPLRIPGLGVELMHHVHADDVAQGFERAIEHREAAAGEDFHVVAPTALNVRGFAHEAAGWFGRTATLESVTWEEFRADTSEEHARVSWEHLYRSHCLTIEKARSLIGYEPGYQPEAAVLESLRWLIEHGKVEVESPLVV